jgi:hypothetical protein
MAIGSQIVRLVGWAKALALHLNEVKPIVRRAHQRRRNFHRC